MRCVSVTVELLVSPTSATRPMVCGKLSGPTALPVLNENLSDVAFGALLAKSPTLQHCPCSVYRLTYQQGKLYLLQECYHYSQAPAQCSERTDSETDIL